MTSRRSFLRRLGIAALALQLRFRPEAKEAEVRYEPLWGMNMNTGYLEVFVERYREALERNLTGLQPYLALAKGVREGPPNPT